MNNTDLLDFYAGLALVGLITKHGRDVSHTTFAELSFLQALMMLEVRKKYVNLSDDD